MSRAIAIPLLLLAACGVISAEPSDERVVVFAAASLTDAFEELAAAYAEDTDAQLVLSFDASSALRAQITEGASADLFVSADLANPQQLVDAGLTDGRLQRFAANGLALVVPAEGADAVATWQDLASNDPRIVAAGEDVPITAYAEELVGALADHPDAPDGFADAYVANVVSREDNVRAVLAKIELGEGDAAIVYETDAASTGAVTTIELPADVDVVADYAFVVLAGAAPPATAFAQWLLGDEAQAILASYGFRPPTE